MQLRNRFRALRLYYKSQRLFFRAFRDFYRAWWFPFAGSGKFRPRPVGEAITVPRHLWTMLPTAGRLILAGAHPRWADDGLHVAFKGLHLVAPPADKSVAISLKEIFVDDVYRLDGVVLDGQLVLDVGAHIGDSSVAFAKRGAVVHAFEPLPLLQDYVRRNIVLNHMQQRIVLHGVGLSDKDEAVDVWVKPQGTAGATTLPPSAGNRNTGALIRQSLRLVDAVSYLTSQGITRVDVLKLDCEGCEYALLTDKHLLNRLKPTRVIMEYHRGGATLYRVLEECGYKVDWPRREASVGYLYATRVQ